MQFEASKQWTALGIPITDIDDAGNFNSYPMMRFHATQKGKTSSRHIRRCRGAGVQ